ncbi:hypothetical protein HanXRQr2_Chr17g0828191 [Helianthus annuus]|uniref:Uncharacterized protein n=1 Tax=Helianthus annuus TaxID=4232 RepID=A0A251RU88_HELAN|nr:hypothetical protein HanXRQr2_Chr17g0828191 [Helianthus annuus]
MLYLYTVPQSKFEIHLREFRNRRKDAVELSWKGATWYTFIHFTIRHVGRVCFPSC